MTEKVKFVRGNKIWCVFLTFFCLIYPSTKSKNWFYPQQCLLHQGMTFLGRVRGRFSRKPYTQIHEYFVLTGTYFREMLVWNISFWDETLIKCSYKQAWILLKSSKKWFTEVVEILKTVLYESAYHWIKRQNVWKKEYTAMFKFFLYWKMTNNFNQSVPQRDFCACFLRTISASMGTVAKRYTLVQWWV